MNYAPIAIFACRRPDHLRDLLNSLKENPEAIFSDLTIFIGGPKYEKDWDLVKDSMRVAEQSNGFKSIVVETKFEITTGSGLIHAGVNQILTSHPSIIVLEDDLIVRRDFLLYMNQGLNQFKDDDRVSQISGWNYGTISEVNQSSTYFFPVPTPWGWATWRRAWNYSSNLAEEFEWLTAKSKRVRNFNFKENYDCLGMIEAVIKENYDAWDAVWYLHLFRNNKLILHPNNSLIINRGFDGSGLNFKHSFQWKEDIFDATQMTFAFPGEIAISPEFEKYLRYLRKWVKTSERQSDARLLMHKIVRMIKQHIRYYRRGYYAGK
jgi:hypothetical protein